MVLSVLFGVRFLSVFKVCEKVFLRALFKVNSVIGFLELKIFKIYEK